MNRQKLFDQALDGVVKQGRPAVDENGNCVLLAEDGCKCAIGHLLTPSLNKTFSTSLVPLSHKKITDYLKVKMPKDTKFLHALQDAHDGSEVRTSCDFYSKGIKVETLEDKNKYNAAFIEEYIDTMKEVAAEYKLEFIL